MPKGFSILLLVIIYMTSEGINKLNNEKQLSFFFFFKESEFFMKKNNFGYDCCLFILIY